MNNKHLNIRINVYSWESIGLFQSSIVPIYISKLKAKNTIKLLLHDNHYWLIKNFNRLGGSFGSTYHHYCENCLCGFHTKQKLKNHRNYCQHFKPTATIMPSKTGSVGISSYLYFKEIVYMYKFPFIIYSDFESLLIKKPLQLSTKTKQLQEHKACGFSIIVIENQENIFYHTVYRGEDCLFEFMKELRLIMYRIQGILTNVVDMIITEAQQKDYENTDICYLCEKLIDPKQGGIKVRDHDHLTGLYRGPTHQDCNYRYRLPKKIPLFIHNLKNYDSHFILANLTSKCFTKCTIIPQSIEKFISFSLDFIQVLDSFNFLNESLEKLVNNLRNSGGDFPITKYIFRDYINDNQENLNFLLRKSFYPYEYMNSFDRFEETSLPPIESFYSSLTLQSISQDDYNFARNVWHKLKFKNLGDYHNFYCLLDSALLADIFQVFRKTVIKTYSLDPGHFYSIPGLAWSAALKYTKIKLHLFDDIDMYMFVEKAIRGGICGVMKRYVKANNELCINYDVSEKDTYLCHLDVNNLYGKALSERLPITNFSWVAENVLNEIDWKNIDTETDVGYIIECDLEYPESLHDEHSDYPLAPVKRKILNSELSAYQTQTLEFLKNYGFKRTAIEKLMLTLDDKVKYTLHFKNLKLYLELILKKVHRGIKFNQLDFLKPYIKLNTDLRKRATNDFEKDLFKLLNNSVFGKSIEDKRKHLNIKMALNQNQVSKWVQKPNFEHFQILNENVAIIKMLKSHVKLDKPIAIGFTVLEISKQYMYSLHYKLFKDYYKDNIQLIYTDTDSLIYEIQTNKYFDDLNDYFAPIMDFSNFDKSHHLFSEKNKKLIGYLKSEYGEKNMNEFVGLKSKLYSILYDETSNKKTAKGLQKNNSK